ncbi:MAG: anaerobic glycerol-3-phosphate dehydrogenase subunit C [bacterium]|nr:anaerobic glycerol-3-phosphate dehydrogenase subunit C [bacterium]
MEKLKGLKRIIKGEVLFDELTRALYSTGASIYKIKPAAVVIPRDKEDVVKLIEYAQKEGLSVIPRGACSSLTGAAIGSGIVIDFTKYMNQIMQVNGDFVDVQPGIVYAGLNKKLAAMNRFFAPDPSSGNFCTIGGMIGCNAGGAHSVKYKATNEYVESLEVVLASGELVNIERSSSPPPTAFKIADKIFNLISKNELLIEERRPKVKRNACGYDLNIIKDGKLNLPRLLVGSEGTLGIITEARLRLNKPLKHKVVALLNIGSLEKVGEAVERLLEFEPSAIELMDEFFINLVKEFEPGLKTILPELSQALLLVELEGEDKDEVRQRAENLKSVTEHIQVAYDLVEQERLWKIRKSAVPIINRVIGLKRPIPFIEDTIVPIHKSGEYINQLHQIFADNQVEACIYGHAGDGNLHIRPRLDLKDNKDIHKMKKIADEVYSLVISLKGSMTAEHGDGFLRTPYLSKQYGPLTSLFKEVKNIFDPQNILNPNKIIDIEESFVHDLIYGWDFNYARTSTKQASSKFDKDNLREEIEKCHSCGQCRNICPVVMETLAEENSPRAKATLLRAIITGDLEGSHFFTKRFKKIFDLCLNCRLCLVQCPTQVDIPQLIIEAKNHYISKMGQIVPEQIIQNPQLLLSISSLMPHFTNLFNRSKFGKAVLEATLGLSTKRDLPQISPKPLTTYKSLSAPKEIKIAYFHGCFANFYSVEDEGLMVIKILERHGVEVILPRQRCCGAPKIAGGNLDAAYENIKYNIEYLSKAISAGYHVVTSCPTCGLMLKKDYPRIMDIPATHLIAQNTSDIHQFLWRLFTNGRLNTDFKPLPGKPVPSKPVPGKTVNKQFIYHQPCHLTATRQACLGEDTLTVQLLKLIPNISLLEIEDSCCGLGGTFGLKKERFELSMKIGENLFQQIKDSNPDGVITSCAGCKMQIEQATNINVYHPIELLNNMEF